VIPASPNATTLNVTRIGRRFFRMADSRVMGRYRLARMKTLGAAAEAPC
jgi:hypothetical protein